MRTGAFWARAANGNAAAAPTPAMNSRRLMSNPPGPRRRFYHIVAQDQRGVTHQDRPPTSGSGQTRTHAPQQTGLHSITWSARARNAGGKVNPIAFAVLRLTTSSNVVGCSTGRAAGFAPFKILSTRSAARRYLSGKRSP